LYHVKRQARLEKLKFFLNPQQKNKMQLETAGELKTLTTVHELNLFGQFVKKALLLEALVALVVLEVDYSQLKG
jgi:hypothetical protein